MEVGENREPIEEKKKKKKEGKEDTYTEVSESRGHNGVRSDKWRGPRRPRRESRAAAKDEVPQVRGISHGRRSFGAYSSREKNGPPNPFRP